MVDTHARLLNAAWSGSFPQSHSLQQDHGPVFQAYKPSAEMNQIELPPRAIQKLFPRHRPDKATIFPSAAAHQADGKESNWIPTDPKRGFEFTFRRYGPTKTLFDEAWVLPDVEKVATGSSAQ